jgi:hypothetical protein
MVDSLGLVAVIVYENGYAGVCAGGKSLFEDFGYLAESGVKEGMGFHRLDFSFLALF